MSASRNRYHSVFQSIHQATVPGTARQSGPMSASRPDSARFRRILLGLRTRRQKILNMPDSKIRPTARPQHVSDSQPVDAVRWRVFLMCFLVVLFDGFDTAAIGYIAPSLMQDWGVAKPALAPVLSAALFGLAAGALMAGPLADRWGRRLALIGSVAVFGAACLASAFSPDLTTLTALRFITGVGLGAAMPNAVTLVSESSPPARRAFITNAMFCGFPLGAALGGFLAGWMIPALGWRSVLQLGGVAPLVLLPALAIWLPESLRYLQTRQNEPDRAQAKAPRSIALVLSRPFRLGSLMLWLAYFMGLVVFYALINWMPVLFRESGMDPRTASLITALFPLGGVGAIALGWLMDRFDGSSVLALGYGATALSVWAIGQAIGGHGVLMAVVFVAGLVMNAAQASMPALAAGFYPTEGRATGVAWMLGIGRFGGIAGSFLVADLTARQMSLPDIFGVVAIAALIAMVALGILRLACRGR